MREADAAIETLRQRFAQARDEDLARALRAGHDADALLARTRAAVWDRAARDVAATIATLTKGDR